MKLSINEKSKIIDVIILLNSRFTKLYSKALNIQRKEYLKQPIIKVNLDDDKDHANFIMIQLNLGIAENNNETKVNDFTLNLTLPDNQLSDMLKQDDQYEIAKCLQNEIIIQLIRFCEADKFANNITDPEVYNDAELDTIGTINFLIQKIIDSHFFNADSVNYVISTIDNINDSILPYLTAVQTADNLFSYFDDQSEKLKFKVKNNQKTTSDHGLIKTQLKNLKTLATNMNGNHKTLTKIAIEAYLFNIYIHHINQEATILSTNEDKLSQENQKTLEILADFIYYSTTQQIVSHFGLN